MSAAPNLRLPTGNATLDVALGGGIPAGTTILVQGEEGAGATEFAMTVLRNAVAQDPPHLARFLSALRSNDRVSGELNRLFPDVKAVETIEVRSIRPRQVEADCVLSILDIDPGGVLVIESASALARTESAKDLLALVQLLGDRAHQGGVVLIVLHAPGTLSEDVEMSLAEAADAVFSFRWLDSGPSRRRILRISKMRGLAPMLDGEQIPIFEVGLHRGTGFNISRVKSLI